MNRSIRLFVIVCLFVLSSACLWAQASGAAPAAVQPLDVYKQLRAPGKLAEAYTVKGVELKRDVGTFTLETGIVCFAEPAGGAVTAASFKGRGSFELQTSAQMEKDQLALLTKEKDKPFLENFESLAIRFTDGTADEIRKSPKASKADPAGCDRSALDNATDRLRNKLHFNLAARLLQDVLSQESDGVFYAFIAGTKYSDKELFAVDPHSVWMLGIDPEEVGLDISDEKHNGTWYAGHLLTEKGTGNDVTTQRNALAYPESQNIDVHIEKSAFLSGNATAEFVSNATHLVAVPLSLRGSLRISKVTDDAGKELKFIQEDKNYDSDYWVILNQPVAMGQKFKITTTYAGKDAVYKEGSGNYMPVARESWYPSTCFGDYATYQMKFHIPKGLTMLATGTKVSESVEGNESVTVWKSDVPLAVAGFNFGSFKLLEAKSQSSPTDVYAAANDELPDVLRPLTNYSLYRSLNTVTLLHDTLAEARNTVDLYTQDFGPAPYPSVAITQQTAFGEGQAWPGVIFVSVDYFLNASQRHFLGMDDFRGFYKILVPHEIAHQWWGHEVGFRNYRDQWMSEGFADFSATLYLQQYRGLSDYLQFWKDEHTSLTERNKFGFRANDVGPLAMGWRVNSAKAGENIYRELVYPKGAYILQMLRMMMWSRQTKDQDFFNMMKDYLVTNQNRPAGMAEFQMVLENHVPFSVTPNNDGKMDWFFKQWIYGTQIPTYEFGQSIDTDAAGIVTLTLRIKQTGVDEDFYMPVGIYVELKNGAVVKLGTVPVRGTKEVNQKIKLGKMADPPKRAILNYQFDVLSSNLTY